MGCGYLAAVSRGAASLENVGACVEFSPSRERPLPPRVSPPLPPKFGARARTGKVGGARPAASPGPEAVPGLRVLLTAAAEPPPAGADPTLRGWGRAPAASARNFVPVSAEPAPSGPGSAPSPGKAAGSEGGRCGPAPRVRTPGDERRQAGAVLPTEGASDRGCLASSPPGPSGRAASGGEFLNRVQGAREAPPPPLLPHPTQLPPLRADNLGTVGELGAARAGAACRPGLGWKKEGRGRS